jgi:outer membrane protein
MLSRISCILFVLFSSVLAQNNSIDSITVGKAIHRAVEKYPAVAQAQAVVAATEAQVDQSRSVFYPEIAGSAAYTRIGPVSQFTLPGEGPIDLYPADNYDFHVGLRQTLYDFSRRSTALELARSGRETALENLEIARSMLAYQTVEVFYAILFLRENISVLDKQIDALNENLAIIRNKVEAGTATDFEILTTQVRVANVQSQRTDVTAALEVQQDVFRQLTGLPAASPILLKGDFKSMSFEPNPDSLINLALQQLPEIKLSRNAESSADIQAHLASLGDRPSLNLNLMFGFKNGYIPNLNTIKANWAAGLQLQAPIFNGFLTRGKTDQARANYNAARFHTEDIERRVTAGVQQAIDNLHASSEKLNTAEPQVAQAEQAVSLAQTRYRAGTATNLDLLDAETALANAQLIRLKAQYDIIRNQYAVNKAVGARIW